MAAEKKLECREGRYGGAQTFSLAEGFIRIYCVSEEGYFEANVNNIRLTKKFKDVDEAKKAAVRVAFKLTGLAFEQIKNFLEE